jgi:chromosome segregation ATPase
MPQKDLEIRVENLENFVAALAGLPQQMQDLSSQFLQLRQEVKADISGIRGEVGELRGEVGELRGEVGELRGEVGVLRGEVGELRTEMHAIRDDLRGEMHAIRNDLRDDMASMHKDLAAAIVANGNEMRALHENLVGQVKLLGEIRTQADAPPQDGAS